MKKPPKEIKNDLIAATRDLTTMRSKVYDLEQSQQRQAVVIRELNQKLTELWTSSSAMWEALGDFNMQLSAMSRETQSATMRVALEGMAGRAAIIRGAIGKAIQQSN